MRLGYILDRMNDWKPVALGVTSTLLFLGTVWALRQIVRFVRGAFMEYRMVRADVARLKVAQFNMKAQILANEFKSYTRDSIPVPPSQSGTHKRVWGPPDLPPLDLASNDQVQTGWEDDELKTSLPE